MKESELNLPASRSNPIGCLGLVTLWCLFVSKKTLNHYCRDITKSVCTVCSGCQLTLVISQHCITWYRRQTNIKMSGDLGALYVRLMPKAYNPRTYPAEHPKSIGAKIPPWSSMEAVKATFKPSLCPKNLKLSEEIDKCPIHCYQKGVHSHTYQKLWAWVKHMSET